MYSVIRWFIIGLSMCLFVGYQAYQHASSWQGQVLPSHCANDVPRLTTNEASPLCIDMQVYRSEPPPDDEYFPNQLDESWVAAHYPLPISGEDQ